MEKRSLGFLRGRNKNTLPSGAGIPSYATDPKCNGSHAHRAISTMASNSILYSMPQYIVSLQFILYGRRPNLLNDSWPLQSPPYAPHYLPYSIYTSLHLLSPILTYNAFHNNNDCLYHSPNNRDFSCT